MTQTTPGQYAQVNGLNLYHETHGSGDPLVLLHGGFGLGAMFGDVLLPALAAGRQVILVDLQGHGRTADIERPLSPEHMADDIAALLDHLGLARADVMGYSLGGSVALRTAIQHPERVQRLVIVSAPHRRAAWHAENLAGMDALGAAQAEPMKQTPMYGAYAAVAPRPEDWERLWGKMGELMRRDYDWSAELRELRVPTLLVFGDADSVSPAQAAEFFGLLGGGLRDGSWDRSGVSAHALAILPRTTHYDIPDSPLLAGVVTQFLATPEGA